METFRGDKIVYHYGKKSILKNGEYLEINNRYYSEIKKIGEEKKEKKDGNKDFRFNLSRRKWRGDMKELTPVERCIVIDIWIYSQNKYSAYPSIRTMADNLKLNKATIVRNIKSLVIKKWFKIVKHKGGRGYKSEYIMIK